MDFVNKENVTTENFTESLQNTMDSSFQQLRKTISQWKTLDISKKSFQKLGFLKAKNIMVNQTLISLSSTMVTQILKSSSLNISRLNLKNTGRSILMSIMLSALPKDMLDLSFEEDRLLGDVANKLNKMLEAIINAFTQPSSNPDSQNTLKIINNFTNLYKKYLVVFHKWKIADKKNTTESLKRHSETLDMIQTTIETKLITEEAADWSQFIVKHKANVEAKLREFEDEYKNYEYKKSRTDSSNQPTELNNTQPSLHIDSMDTPVVRVPDLEMEMQLDSLEQKHRLGDILEKKVKAMEMNKNYKLKSPKENRNYQTSSMETQRKILKETVVFPNPYENPSISKGSSFVKNTVSIFGTTSPLNPELKLTKKNEFKSNDKFDIEIIHEFLNNLNYKLPEPQTDFLSLLVETLTDSLTTNVSDGFMIVSDDLGSHRVTLNFAEVLYSWLVKCLPASVKSNPLIEWVINEKDVQSEVLLNEIEEFFDQNNLRKKLKNNSTSLEQILLFVVQTIYKVSIPARDTETKCLEEKLIDSKNVKARNKDYYLYEIYVKTLELLERVGFDLYNYYLAELSKKMIRDDVFCKKVMAHFTSISTNYFIQDFKLNPNTLEHNKEYLKKKIPHTAKLILSGKKALEKSIGLVDQQQTSGNDSSTSLQDDVLFSNVNLNSEQYSKTHKARIFNEAICGLIFGTIGRRDVDLTRVETLRFDTERLDMLKAGANSLVIVACVIPFVLKYLDKNMMFSETWIFYLLSELISNTKDSRGKILVTNIVLLLRIKNESSKSGNSDDEIIKKAVLLSRNVLLVIKPTSEAFKLLRDRLKKFLLHKLSNLPTNSKTDLDVPKGYEQITKFVNQFYFILDHFIKTNRRVYSAFYDELC
ncbi:hypothetical protein BB559_004968 [Furculomyces boomerangus]|uniref:Uncharacterized protein n=1 Tax=Furculomyces boomerangus TaxID=61424 RepID=A0A2T9YBR5_9FUNG|nr:hypothetical protein BB559_004968 [Furculomyces boomerangus]